MSTVQNYICSPEPGELDPLAHNIGSGQSRESIPHCSVVERLINWFNRYRSFHASVGAMCRCNSRWWMPVVCTRWLAAACPLHLVHYTVSSIVLVATFSSCKRSLQDVMHGQRWAL